jgi:hypothetical protein
MSVISAISAISGMLMSEMASGSMEYHIHSFSSQFVDPIAPFSQAVDDQAIVCPIKSLHPPRTFLAEEVGPSLGCQLDVKRSRKITHDAFRFGDLAGLTN